MVDILHRVGITASQGAVYRALTTPEGLAAWWTNETRGDGGPGGTLEFRFGAAGGFDMKVMEAEPAERVVWEVRWATFLMSLKSLLETGTGAPAPDDVRISDWH